MSTQQNRIIYYAQYKSIPSQTNCYMFQINCLLDNGTNAWIIDDCDLDTVLLDNGIVMKGSPVNVGDYSIIKCDPIKMNIDDFYTYSEAKGENILMWRTFNILYDINIKQPIFGKYSNIEHLEEMFEYIITGALSRINI
jgi:hypothetical protein